MGREWRSDHRDRGDLATRADLVIAELAERQDGIVERRQLLAMRSGTSTCEPRAGGGRCCWRADRDRCSRTARLVDVAGVEPPRLVSRAVDAALQQQRYDQRSIDAEIRTGRQGAGRLRRVLEERHPDAHLTRSELEARALESLAGRDLPRPAVNVWLADLGVEVDLLWPDRALVVELDGRRYHAHRRRADAERDDRLRAAGLKVRRYGWGDVVSGWMAADVAARLAR